ncbi:MAG: squalene synthase HpnC [Brachymonas sp.]|nr:squalene synthase HpnC [Brachymonas sp.]
MRTAPDNHPSTHYENFPVAGWLCPQPIRPAVVALYHFARTADDLADEGDASAEQRLANLQGYREALNAACASPDVASGQPWHAVMQPLQAAIRQHSLPQQPLHDLITAFERDVRHTANGHVYADWDELADYARHSANPVGRLMLHLYGIDDAESLAQSDAICTALQYYNFWQDISVDIARQRYYLPESVCQPLGIDPRQPQTASKNAQARLLQTLLDPTDALMQQGSPLPRRLAQHPRKGSRMAALELQMVVQGGWRIGQKTRRLGAAAVTTRPVLHLGDWLLVAARGLGKQLLP